MSDESAVKDPAGAASTVSEPPPADAPARRPNIWRQYVDNPWVVLIMLFFVTAALGLPVLWVSRGFSPLAKVAVSVIVLIYTAIVLLLFSLLMWWCWQQISNSLQAM